MSTASPREDDARKMRVSDAVGHQLEPQREGVQRCQIGVGEFVERNGDHAAASL